MKEYLDYLGVKCRDCVTGMEGTVQSVSFDLYGCVQVSLTPAADKDGKINDSYWFDHKRLEIIDKKPVMKRPTFEQMRVGEEIGPANKGSPRT